MNDEKLKIVLAVLGGIVFGMIFILFAFVVPLRSPSVAEKSMDSELQRLSKEYKKNQFTPPPPQKGH